ncbi:MAG: hypothetical protein JKY52_19910 [Flavobacteriales bacterium]|nr:hypothetical protein [Flavobacteriales bacterium]
MLIDYIDIEKLPFFVVWLDWIFFVYWDNLLLGIVYFYFYYRIATKLLWYMALGLALMVGTLGWVFVCLVVGGYAVG